MTDNLSMKRALIMQSFAPLFLILMIKYFDMEVIYLCGKFLKLVLNNPINAFAKMVVHPANITVFLEIFSLLWIIYSLYSVKTFENSQRANFISEGAKIINTEEISDTGVTFFMTYVLPMAMDDMDTLKGVILFGILMAILFTLMWKTNLFYQNPILTVLGYKIFSFEFEMTQLTEYRNKKCIGITRGKINKDNSIKWQKVSDNVFIILEDK